jgi:hypothetical protein
MISFWLYIVVKSAIVLVLGVWFHFWSKARWKKQLCRLTDCEKLAELPEESRPAARMGRASVVIMLGLFIAALCFLIDFQQGKLSQSQARQVEDASPEKAKVVNLRKPKEK